MGARDLTLEGVPPLLLRLGLVREQDLVEPGLRVEEGLGRNRCFRALLPGMPGFFLKQGAAGPDGAAEAEARIEHEVYARAREGAPFAALGPFLPRLHALVPAEILIVLEDLGDLNLFELEVPASGEEGARFVLDQVGRALAACHGIRPTAADDPVLPRAIPWPLDATRPYPEALRHLAPAQIQVLRAAQDTPDLDERLDALRARWLSETLIHGDFKWANVLVTTDPATGAPNRVALVDWELAAFGDPAWDLGSAVHSLLCDRLVDLDLPVSDSVEEAVAAFGRVLPAFREEAGRLWRAYLTHAGVAGARRDDLLDRTVGCCGARMIQTAYEWSHARQTMSRTAAGILQVGVNLLKRPVEAGAAMLGLGAAP